MVFSKYGKLTKVSNDNGLPTTLRQEQSDPLQPMMMVMSSEAGLLSDDRSNDYIHSRCRFLARFRDSFKVTKAIKSHTSHYGLQLSFQICGK